MAARKTQLTSEQEMAVLKQHLDELILPFKQMAFRLAIALEICSYIIFGAATGSAIQQIIKFFTGN